MGKRYFYLFTVLALMLALTAALALTGCAPAEEAAAPAATSTPEMVEAPLATPVITYSEPKTLPLPEGALPPAAYTRVTEESLPAETALFTFTDGSGNPVYRVYAGVEELVDGVPSDTVAGYYPADASGALTGGEAVVLEEEPLGQCTPMALPEGMRLKAAYTPTGNTGHVQSADPEHPGFLVYGAFELDDSGEGVFYPANPDGSMIAGSLPVDYTVTVPAYTPADKPAKDGDRKIVVYIGTESVVVYKAVNVEWTEERVMICSTGRKKEMTPRGDFNLMKQYLYKKMGEVQGENVYSQYASRITGSYLFHSVPIGGKNRFQPSVGVKQMFVKYYEQLGTVASGGCVRLLCADAYWVYMNCETGTPVTVTDDSGPEPPTPPALIYEEPYMDKRHQYGWDPTDPNPENPYHAVYEPEFVLTGAVPDKSDKDYVAGEAAADEAETGATS